MSEGLHLDLKKCTKPGCSGVLHYPIEDDYSLMKCLDCGRVLVHRKRRCEHFVPKEKPNETT